MNTCINCENENIIFVDSYLFVCENCGAVQPFRVFVKEKDNNFIQYQEQPYKCSYYFKRILRCLQDKSNSKIPEEIVNILKNTDRKPRDVLKEYKLFHLYILLPQIEYVYRDKKPIKLTESQESQLIEMFNSVEKQIRNKYPKRNQILRYKPILKKLLEKIGLFEISEIIPDLRTKKSKKEFNRIWSEIKL